MGDPLSQLNLEWQDDPEQRLTRETPNPQSVPDPISIDRNMLTWVNLAARLLETHSTWLVDMERRYREGLPPPPLCQCMMCHGTRLQIQQDALRRMRRAPFRSRLRLSDPPPPPPSPATTRSLSASPPPTPGPSH